ncbi:MAG: group 1 glycosyl transferase [Parcubacteria group bacterium Gr01-1014_31]|nr:MAG: group 1 glycosyl transferase [Parcubacteria group bacterium Gr01-1014_31]
MSDHRLLIAAEIFPPAIGGPATYAATLARELPALGWEVTVVCYADQVAGEYPDPVIAVPRRGGPLARYCRYFFTIWKEAKHFRAVYAQGTVSSGLPALVVTKLRRKKLVVKVTGDYAWEQAFRAGATGAFIEEFQRQSVRGKYALLRFIERLVCRHADLVITPSVFLKTIVRGWGVPDERIAVVYNAPSFPIVAGDKDQLRAQFNIAANDTLVVSVGRPVPWKGFGALGRAVAELLIAGRNIRLVCIGITDEELRAMMADADAPDLALTERRIVGLGVTNSSRVFDWLRAADAFVLNTAYEGLSHIILEAMYAGVPVITTTVGGNRELIRDGETGVLIPYNDVGKIKQAIAALAQDRRAYASLAQRAQEELKKFSLPAMLEATVVQLERL